MYEHMTPEKIKATILATLKTDIDKREGSFADDMCGPLAVELYKLYGSLEGIPSMIWVNETSGKYLDLAADDLGIEPRKDGTCAQATLEITGKAGHLIPAGTKFHTEERLYFLSAKDTVISQEGAASVPVTAEKVGRIYNVDPDTIIYLVKSSPQVKTIGHSDPGAGGTDPETDASLYSRIVAARQRPSTSGNAYDYERWALEAPGVGLAKITPLWNGNGTVRVLIADEQRQPVDHAVLQGCAEHIEAVRPIGANVTVASAQAFTVDVAVTITIDTSMTKEAVQAAFEAELENYFRSISFVRQDVPYNRVGAMLFGIDGIMDYSGLRLNGQNQNIPLSDEQVPVLGEVSITWN